MIMSKYRGPVSVLTAIVCGVAVFAAPSVPAEVGAQIVKLGDYQSWSAFALSENGVKTCYMASEPNSSPNADSRAKPFAFVTHRPAKKALNVLTIFAGYAFEPGSRVTLEIGPRRFALFTDSDAAWAGEADLDEQVVKAMRAGKTMVVRGRSAASTETADTYSLAGFALAYRRMSEECKVPVK